MSWTCSFSKHGLIDDFLILFLYSSMWSTHLHTHICSPLNKMQRAGVQPSWCFRFTHSGTFLRSAHSQNNKTPQLKNIAINMQKRKHTAAVTSSVNSLIWSKSHMLIFCFPPTEVQTLGTTHAATAKAPKADFLQKQCNLTWAANLGVKNMILLFK